MASAPSHEMVPFADATKVTRLAPNVYGANLVSAWCIGSGSSSPPGERPAGGHD